VSLGRFRGGRRLGLGVGVSAVLGGGVFFPHCPRPDGLMGQPHINLKEARFNKTNPLILVLRLAVAEEHGRERMHADLHFVVFGQSGAKVHHELGTWAVRVANFGDFLDDGRVANVREAGIRLNRLWIYNRNKNN
jgi:hypothetical protein